MRRAVQVTGLAAAASAPTVVGQLAPELAAILRQLGEGGIVVALVALVVYVARMSGSLERLARTARDHETRLVDLEGAPRPRPRRRRRR